MRVIWEFMPEKKFWVIWPSCILFQKGSESDEYCDLTIAWLKMAVSLRFGERKTQKNKESANTTHNKQRVK